MDNVISGTRQTSETKPKKAVVELRQQKSEDRLVHYAKEVFEIEAEAITALSQRVDDVFPKAVKAILNCEGRVIVCGMGKSGIVGRKISCTLASTGTPSFFMHPAEAFHGDLGMIKKEDILLLISYSGETEEIVKIIPFLKSNGNRIISMTGNPNSTIANSSDCHLNVSVKREACPLKIAPTTSATAALVMGDAITVALMREKGFKTEDYARFHPGGNAGRMLLMRVEDVMVKSNLPVITEDSDMKEVIQVMTSGRWGTGVVVNEQGHVIGIITDGDLRRALAKHGNILMLKAIDIMTKHPRTISKNLKLYEAEKIFNKQEIIILLVCDEKEEFVGLLPISLVCTPKG
jgi:arabinose-5-phosphate isomerase